MAHGTAVAQRPAAAPPRADRRLTAALAAAGAVALGAAIQVKDGMTQASAFVWLSIAVVAVVLAVVLPNRPRVEERLRRWLPGLLVAGLVGQLVALVHTLPAWSFTAAPGWRPIAIAAVVGAGLAGCAVAWGRGVVRGVAVGVLLAIHVALGVWAIRLQPVPVPPIDVFVFQHDAAAALRAGVDPYSITFPNPYPDTAYYEPGLVVNGRLDFGFPYPPLSAYVALVGQWLGDVRYAQLAATTVAGLLLATVRPRPLHQGPMPPLAAALYLFTPRVLLIVERSWTEPTVVLLLVATVWCAVRHPRGAPVALGLFLAAKQYALLALPLTLLVGRPPMSLPGLRRTAGPAVLVAAAVTLPLALVDLPGFLYSVVVLHIRQPFRPESLSYLAVLAGPHGGTPAAALGFAAAVGAGGLALWRVARTPAGFALGVAVLFLVFFALGKQAAANYYFFVIGALCTAVAAADPPETPRVSESPA